MARAQTVFSELCVAKAISGGGLRNIKNVSRESVSQFEAELKRRLSKDQQSINELTVAGNKVKDWLSTNSRTNEFQVVWAGMDKSNDHGPVAIDLLIEKPKTRISVKENAQLFQNPSPVKVFQNWPKGNFNASRDGDWFIEVAKTEINDYFQACGGLKITGFRTVTEYYKNVTGKDSNGLKKRKKFTEHVTSLHERKLQNVIDSYQTMCRKVSNESARIFNENMGPILDPANGKISSNETLRKLFSFYFKLDNEKYLLCGTENNQAFAVVVDDLETWESKFSIVNIQAKAMGIGQAETLLTFTFCNKTNQKPFEYSIKAEIRWSHGKFCGNPESKLYKHKSWSYKDLPWAECI
jgi:hypothetical protein